jgi:predicted PurR-regulated permease PerM
MEERVIHLSLRTVLVTLSVFLAGYILFLIRDIVFALFVALLLSSILEPLATRFEKNKIPRSLATVLVYLAIFGFLGIMLSFLMPVIIRDLPQVVLQLKNFIINFPFPESFQFLGDWAHSIKPSDLSLRLDGLFVGVGNIFEGIVTFFLILVLAFYMVSQKDPLRKILHSVVPEQYLGGVLVSVEKVRNTLGSWVRAQLILSAIVGVVVFIGLTLFGVKYAIVIALLAALFEFVPFIGPILATLPSLLFSFIQGGFGLFLFVFIFYVFVQQIQNHFVIPKVMQKVVGLNPIVSLIAVLVGAKLGGVLGALVAIPVAITFHVLVEEQLEKRTRSSLKI